MTRPSEPLLRWLRAQVDARKLNTAALAGRLGRPRKEVRELLTGAVPMTLDDLVLITQALELNPEDLVAAGAPPVSAPEVEPPEPVQFRNQPEALIRLGFDLGIDILFSADTAQLEGWGGPEEVLSAYPRGLPIRLDAEYHRYMEPEFDVRGFTVLLVFGDRKYRCRFPWRSITQVVFQPFPPDDIPEEEPPPEPERPKGRPHLRLVT